MTDRPQLILDTSLDVCTPSGDLGHRNPHADFQHGTVSLLGHAQLPQHERECQASSEARTALIVPSGACENFLYYFQGGPTGPLAPPTRRPGRRLSWRSAPARPVPAGWRETKNSGPPLANPEFHMCGRVRSRPAIVRAGPGQSSPPVHAGQPAPAETARANVHAKTDLTAQNRESRSSHLTEAGRGAVKPR